jgi:hypothetical protein
VLAGTVVAYAESRLELGGRPPELVVARSITTGRALHNVQLNVATIQRTLVESARALRAAVNGAGAVAWIQEDWFARHGGNTPPPIVYDIFAIDNSGFQPLRIDLPAEPKSLKLTRNVLSWTQQEHPQSTMLH